MGQYYQKILTKNLSPIVYALGVDHLTKPFFSGKGQIVVLHRVLPLSDRERIHNHLSLEISTEQLENIFTFFRRKDYDFIDLDMLPEWLRKNRNSSRKFVSFTFDDGYKDNLYYAYPVFKKHNIPFTVYITNSFPDKRAIIWWYILEDLVLKNSRIRHSFSTGTVNIRCNSYRKKEMAFVYLRKLFTQLKDTNLEQELGSFFTRFGLSIYDPDYDLALNWNEISELSKDPIVTIGGHTLNHYNLCKLTDEQSFFEISESKKLLEANINKKVNHFSYPFGEFGIREMGFVKKSNFLTATTTDNANIFYSHINHQFTLPRIAVNALSTEKVLNLQVNGFFPAILNKFRRIIY
jgi:peptidoglycan/xylan/chitin deacetylase (PgdA/CDA1 family)